MSLASFFSEGKKKQTSKRKNLKLKPKWQQKLEQVWQKLKARLLFHIGVSTLHRGKYQRAAQILEQVAQVLDNDPFVQVHLGWSHWHLGHPVTARRHLLRATELDPDNPAFWTLAGKLMALRGKWDEAEQLLRQAILLSPQNIVAQSWLAYVLFQREQVEEALDILKRFPVADDPYLQARLVLHLERLMMKQGEEGGAIFTSTPNWLKLPPLSSLVGVLLRWRGERLIEDGEWEAAARLLGTASQLRPKDVWAKLLWAVALLEGGFWAQAEQVLNEVPEFLPEKAWVYGALLVRQQRVKDAVTQLMKSDTNHPFVRYYLALSLDWVGEAEYACAAYLEPLYREDPASLRQRIRELVRRLKP
ncbi:MAG: tetratricopeptide repeat protein [Armatimonadetes bacterium]|nr:tetratricopeptide repeat protein [Armatimonadota bacterium]MCX7967975.1 tetratricopeptide repeat protein [Armatimonadota bacterium]MDW8142411.1 tetratricopeptide repeat protein [Armatimonadota bacterium]